MEQQEAQYTFPYHWIPTDDDMVWGPSRVLPWVHEYAAVLEEVKNEVLRRSPSRILDFGCGDGRLACSLGLSSNAHVVGVDSSNRAIAFARAFSLAHGIAERVTFHAGDIDEFKARDPFDVIVAMEVLEHIPDDVIPTVLAALSRVLSDEGVVIVSVPTTVVPVIGKHFRHYTVELLTEQLAPHFSLEEHRYVHRNNRVRRLLRQLTANRLFSLRNRRALSIVQLVYNQYCRTATLDDGVHLLAALTRTGE